MIHKRNIWKLMKNKSNMKNQNDMEKKAGLKRSGLLFGVTLLFFAAGVTLNGCGASKVKMLAIFHLQTDYRVNPVGIDDPIPVFSWQMSSEEKDKSQSAYRIRVYESNDSSLDAGDINQHESNSLSDKAFGCVWDSGKVESDLSVSIPYEGEELKPQTRYDWSVEVWDEEDKNYTSEEAAYFETGLMGEFPEEAHWISVQDTFVDENSDLQSINTIVAIDTMDDLDGNMAVDAGQSYSAVSTYSIQYMMEVQNTSACFAFGAENGRYGSMTLCEIENQDEETVFTIKDMAEFNSNTEFPSVYVDTAMDGNYQVNLRVRDQQMEVAINGSVVGEFLIPSTSPGAIGYYKSRGTQYAYLDDIVVKDELGNICYEETFEEESTIFAPYHVVVENGRCKVGSGLMLSGGMEYPAPVFERTLELEEKEIDHARLYLTALGSYEVSIDGQAVTDNFMDPGKLAYNQYLSYLTYDVTDILRGEKPREERGEEQTEKIPASHIWRMTLFHGWYDRGVGYPEIYSPWGEKNALRGVLVVTYQDGSQQIIGTDEEFQVTLDGPIRENDVYQGEFYDVSKAIDFNGVDSIEDDTAEYTGKSIDNRGTDAGNKATVKWQPAAVDDVDSRYNEIPYIGKANEAIRCVQELTPISVSEPVSGTYVYDFGQNFAGVCRIKMNAGEGDLVTLRYGEALNTENLRNRDDAVGTIWTENLLTADATDYYLAVEGEQTYQPVSVYHGFRYLQITGLNEAPAVEDVTGIVLSSDQVSTGEFECSDELVNQYWSNAVWSQRSNFVDNPTDCAQRDERHGWAGDAQIFSGMACYNSAVDEFYRKYLTELCDLQSEDGAFPDMAPRNFGTGWDGRGGASGNNCWGDAAIVIAWNLYTQYGDVNVLDEHYQALCKWVDYLEEHSENGLRLGETGYGDHFSVESTPKGLTDTAWSAHSADLLSKISTILGKEQEAIHYNQLFEQFRDAWLKEYVSEDGVIECYSQTAYALGLEFQLFPENLRQTAAECLLNNVTFNQYEFHAGYAGLSYLLPALSEAGYSDAAYEILCNTGERSLLYPVTQGATTTPEYLSAYQEIDDELLLDGSLNHYAYGAPAEWLYTHVLGIQSDEEHPGFKHFYIKPEVTGKWTYARGAYESMYGRIEVSWEQKEDGYEYHIVIPANTTATVELVGMERMELGSGSYDFVN